LEPLFSVVIPAYRVTAYIAETLQSVVNQTFQNFEAIVVNDCCPDSVALERAIEPFRDRMVYVKHERNGGLAAARNTAIRIARGEWIAFLDGDDFWEPNYLEVQNEMIAAHPEASVIYGNARIVGSIHDGQPSQSFSPSQGPVTLTSLLNETVNIAVMNVTRRSALLEAGLFDESFRRCEDFDLWTRMLRRNVIFRYHSRVIAGYRRRGDSLSADAARMYESRLAVLEKLERDSTLDPGERAALNAAKLRWKAAMNLELSKVSLEQGASKDAARYMRDANAYFRRPHLALIQFLMERAPALLQSLMRLRRKWIGY
jgi:glycosyltransferase involved in cell wall biosynthesis